MHEVATKYNDPKHGSLEGLMSILKFKVEADCGDWSQRTKTAWIAGK